jgi:hypothetical protein
VIFLPKNLGTLATLAAGDEGVRYALSGVHVLDEGDYYRCEVSDGRVLAIVCGPDARATDAAQRITDEQLQAVEEAPGGTFDVIVPAGRWKEAFRQLPRDAALGLTAGEGVITLASPHCVARCTPTEGRWPDVDSVLPPGGPLVRLRVNPKMLARLLEVAAAFSAPDPFEPPAVDLLWYGRDKPLGVVGKNREGQIFDALLMPLTDNPPPPRPRPPAGDGGEVPTGTPPAAGSVEPDGHPQRNGHGKPPLAASAH